MALVLVTLASSTTSARAERADDETSATEPTWPVETDLSATTTCLIWAACAAKSLRNDPVASSVTRAMSRSKVR